jgi:hypothetical protein
MHGEIIFTSCEAWHVLLYRVGINCIMLQGLKQKYIMATLLRSAFLYSTQQSDDKKKIAVSSNYKE